MADSKRRSVRQQADRKRSRSIYYEPDTDEELDLEHEDVAGEQDSEQDFELEPSRPQRSNKKRKVASRKTKPQTRSRASVKSHRVESRKPPPGRRKKTRRFDDIPSTPLKQKDIATKFAGASDGRIPAWTGLPLEILREIFVFASQPIHEQTTTAGANVTWLIRAARTCRAFAVPALEAYYFSPSLLNNMQPHYLLELMQIPKEKTYIDYRVKVKSLEIDIRRLAYATHGKHKLDLSTLIERLPQLQALEVLHPVDTPPFRPLKIQPWTYPIALFDAFTATGQRLKSWRWNRDMIPRSVDGNLYRYLTQIHSSKTFEHLERLAVCGFDFNDSLDLPSQDAAVPATPGLAVAISALPHLKDLTFISCDYIMEDFLECLPKRLERLELSNCLEVTSEMLQMYLLNGGSQLRELVLNHNAALSLSFLPHLKRLCPRLEVLEMDFTYYSERYNYNDAWAMYDQLLAEDDVPTWPSTLRRLELVSIQKISTDAARNLFRSLVDDAKDLPDLRHLVIQAHINTPWRDRAGFRDQWIERLQRVYLRRSEEPNPHLGSLRQFKLWKQGQVGGTALVSTQDGQMNTDSGPLAPIRLRLSHVRVTPRKAPKDVEVFFDTDSDIDPAQKSRSRVQLRRSTRVAESQSASAPEEESSSDSEAEDDWRTQPEAFIHGLCQVVDIRIDNQRPRENQYTEANFLDSEPSGDEDWHSGAELSEDDHYAW